MLVLAPSPWLDSPERGFSMWSEFQSAKKSETELGCGGIENEYFVVKVMGLESTFIFTNSEIKSLIDYYYLILDFKAIDFPLKCF